MSEQALAVVVEPPAQPKPPSLQAGAKVAPIIPRTVEEVARVAKAVIVAKLAPNSYEGATPDETMSKIMIGIMKGAECGFAPITALSTIAIINNRPCIWGDGAVALAQARGVVDHIETHYEGEEGADDYTAVYRAWRKGQSTPYEGRFSIKDAKRAGLWNNPRRSPWMQYPYRMLMMRARAYALRDGFADCLSGLSVAEEVQDIPAAPQPVSTDFLDDDPKTEQPDARLAEAATPAQHTQPAETGPAAAASASPPQSPPVNPWLISPETFQNAASFITEFRRQLSDVIEGPSDVDALLTANAGRLAELPKATRDALLKDAERMRGK